MKKIIVIPILLFCCLQANGQDYLKKANACFEIGEYECAKRNYTLFQTLDGKDMSVQIQIANECMRALNLADDYFKDEDYEKAKKRYQLVLEKNAKDSYAKRQYDLCEEYLKLSIFYAKDTETNIRNIHFNHTGGISENIIVHTSDTSWNLFALPFWCSVTNKTNDSFQIECQQNYGEAREDSLMVRTDSSEFYISISQDAKEVEEIKQITEVTTTTDITMHPSIPKMARFKTSYGVKGGLHVSSLNHGDANLGFHLGALINMRFGYRNKKAPGIIGLQPELLYTRIGDPDINLNYIMAPVILKFYIVKGINLEIGPYFSYLLAVSPESIEKYGYNNDPSKYEYIIMLSDLKGTWDSGVGIGIGFETEKITISGRFVQGLSEFAGNLPWKNVIYCMLSFGYKF